MNKKNFLTKFLIRFSFQFTLLFVLIVVFDSCKQKKPKDSDVRGTIYISVDESFKPVIDEQIKVFEMAYPETKIIATYKPEADCLKDLDNDSTKLIIVTQPPTRQMQDYYFQKLEYKLGFDILAYDGIAVIVNKNNTDTMFTRAELKELLKGSSDKKYRVVFDGLNATSSIRYAIDSILGGEMFDTSRVSAAKSSNEVIDYIAANENAIGMVGVSWIGNPEDTAQLKMLNKVKIALLKCEKCIKSEEGVYLRPTQRFLYTGQYPLTRGLYYIVKEGSIGIGKSFAQFMKFERGQLIFRRAYLAPAQMPFTIRSSEIKNK